MKTVIATTFAAAMLAASSFAFAADNTGGKDGVKTDVEKTGSITKSSPDTVPLEDREFCIANPSDAKCQKLGGETNQ